MERSRQALRGGHTGRGAMSQISLGQFRCLKSFKELNGTLIRLTGFLEVLKDLKLEGREVQV